MKWLVKYRNFGNLPPYYYSRESTETVSKKMSWKKWSAPPCGVDSPPMTTPKRKTKSESDSHPFASYSVRGENDFSRIDEVVMNGGKKD